MEREIDHLQSRLDQLQTIVGLDDRLQILENEFIWAETIELEKISKHKDLVVEKLEETVNEFKERIKSAENEYHEVGRKELNSEQEIAALQNEIDNCRCSLTEMQEKSAQLKCQERDIMCKVQKFNKEIMVHENLQNGLKYNQKRSVERFKEAEKEYLKKKNNHEKIKENLIAQLDILQEKAKDQQKLSESYQENLQAKTNDYMMSCENVKLKEKEIAYMQRCQQNKMLSFGRETPKIIKEIDNLYRKGVFSKQPIGPLGSHIRIRDPKWTLAIEVCLGRKILGSYLCCNTKDAENLQNTFLRIGVERYPQVIACKFYTKVYDVTEHHVQGHRYSSVFEMLSETNPTILNHIIDFRGIENIILIEGNAEARHIMLHEVPQRCNEAYTINGNLVPAKPFAFYANKQKTPMLLSTCNNFQEQLNLHQKELENLKKIETVAQKEAEFLMPQACGQQNVLRKIEVEIQQLKNQKIYQELEIDECEQQLLEINNTHSGTDELKSAEMQLNAAMKHKEEAESALNNVMLHLRKQKENEREINKNMNEKTTKLNNLMKICMKSCGKNKEILLNEKKSMEGKYENLLMQLESEKNVSMAVRNNAQEIARKAEELCPRINTKRKAKDIQKCIEAIKDIMLQETEGISSYNGLQLKFNQKLRIYKKAKEEIRFLSSYLEKMKNVMIQRLDLFKAIRSTISIVVKTLFVTNMRSQNYCGKLLFNHQDCSLEILASHNGTNERSLLSAKSLSGGERSFATVALMLALWNTVEAPFRILDEYDVFMDQVNRKRSMDLMLHSALNCGTNQFIFLSPLDQVELPSSPKIKILKMRAPKRRNTEHDDESSQT